MHSPHSGGLAIINGQGKILLLYLLILIFYNLIFNILHFTVALEPFSLIDNTAKYSTSKVHRYMLFILHFFSHVPKSI